MLLATQYTINTIHNTSGIAIGALTAQLRVYLHMAHSIGKSIVTRGTFWLRTASNQSNRYEDVKFRGEEGKGRLKGFASLKNSTVHEKSKPSGYPPNKLEGKIKSRTWHLSRDRDRDIKDKESSWVMDLQGNFCSICSIGGYVMLEGDIHSQANVLSSRKRKMEDEVLIVGKK